jgi:hypothetical protein
MANFSGWKLIGEINITLFIGGLIAESVLKKLGTQVIASDIRKKIEEEI